MGHFKPGMGAFRQFYSTPQLCDRATPWSVGTPLGEESSWVCGFTRWGLLLVRGGLQPHTLVVSREREPPRRPSFFTLQASREAFRLRRASLDRDLRRVPILWGEVLHDEPNIRVKH